MSEIMDWEVDGIVDEDELESFLDRINNDAPLDQGDAKLMLAYYRAQLAACAAGPWRYDVENAPKYVWVSVWYAEHPDDWFKARLNGDDCWETGLYLKTRTPDAFAVPNQPQVTT